jgi:hypothetical protein
MLRVIVKNNLIAIAIHIGICLFSLLFFSVTGIVFFMFPAPIVLTLLVFYLYFMAGKLFLNNTNNTLINIFSIMALPIILIVTIAPLEGAWWILANFPFATLGGLSGNSIPMTIPASLLPSLALWIGIAKQANDVSFDSEEELSHDE